MQNNDTEIRIEVSPSESTVRADVALQQQLILCCPEKEALFSRNYIQKLFDENRVTIEGKTVKKSDKIRKSVSMTVALPPLRPAEAQPEDIPLDIYYEDNDLLVVNKPKGMVVHPAPGNPDGTLVNALLAHCHGSLSGINGVERPGIVHRIDKGTSGLLVVAKNDAAHLALAKQISEHTVTRRYFAVVYGHLKDKNGTVNEPIGRNPNDRFKYCVISKNSKEAVTDYKVLEEYEGFSLIECRLHTGRTHQIRVHMAYLGHPLAGDPLYGPRKVITKLNGQCLHAGILGFIHPVTGEYMEFQAPLPDYFTDFINSLRR